MARLHELLVERAKVLFDLGFTRGRGEKLDSMNSDKKGRSFRIP